MNVEPAVKERLDDPKLWKGSVEPKPQAFYYVLLP
jgi:hypothetical protein